MSDTAETTVNETETITTKSKGNRGRPRIHPFPHQLTCIKCVKTFKTNPTQCKVSLEKSGKTLADFVTTYVCRSCRAVK